MEKTNETNERRINRLTIELKSEKEKSKKLHQENLSFWRKVIALQTKLASKEWEQVAAKLSTQKPVVNVLKPADESLPSFEIMSQGVE